MNPPDAGDLPGLVADAWTHAKPDRRAALIWWIGPPTCYRIRRMLAIAVGGAPAERALRVTTAGEVRSRRHHNFPKLLARTLVQAEHAPVGEWARVLLAATTSDPYQLLRMLTLPDPGELGAAAAEALCQADYDRAGYAELPPAGQLAARLEAAQVTVAATWPAGQ